jgi:hypothetical protein
MCCLAGSDLGKAGHPLDRQSPARRPVRALHCRRPIAPAQGACNWLMRRLNRRSVIIIAMLVLMGLSVVIVLYEVRLAVPRLPAL